jgi:hypothetical protein
MHHAVLPESFAPKDQARVEAPQAHQNRVTEKLHPDFEIGLLLLQKNDQNRSRSTTPLLHLRFSVFRLFDTVAVNQYKIITLQTWGP